MSKIYLVVFGILLINLSGCDNQKNKTEDTSKQEVKRNIMGDGNKPMPKLSDYEKKQ